MLQLFFAVTDTAVVVLFDHTSLLIKHWGNRIIPPGEPANSTSPWESLTSPPEPYRGIYIMRHKVALNISMHIS